MTPEQLRKLLFDALGKKEGEPERKADESKEDFAKRKEKLERENLEAKQRSLKIDAEKLRVIMAQNEALKERGALEQNAIALLDKYKDILEEAYEDVDGMSEANRRRIEEETGLTIEQIEKLRQLKAEYESLGPAGVAAYDTMAPKFKDLAVKIGALSPAANNLLGSFVQLNETLATDAGKKGMFKAFRESFNMQNIALSIGAKVFEQTLALTFAVDEATAAFAKATGAGRAFTQEIMNVGGGFRNLGLDAAGAGKAVGALFDGFTGFTQASQAERTELVKTVASLERIGVSGQTAAKNLQLMQRNFGLSGKEANKMTKQLAIAGTKIGISSTKMMEGFAAASKSLAVYGKDAIKVFTDLAAQAKAAGVEASALLGIAEKFDTFEGAADSVGKLNSILGTNLSAIDMLSMKENERIETMIRSIQAQGIAFKDLGRFEQKAVAAAAGISDLGEAQRIFGMSVNDYRKGLKEAATEEEFNKRLKDAMTTMEKFRKIAQNFAIQIAPLVEVLATIAQGALDFSEKFKGIPAMIALAAGALVLLPAMVPALGGFFTAMTAGLASMAAGLSAASVGATAMIPAILAIGAAIALVVAAGGGIFASMFPEPEMELKIAQSKERSTKATNKMIATLDSKSPTIDPILSNIALITTGNTSSKITKSVSVARMEQLTANIENAVKANIKVYIGDKELKTMIRTEVSEAAVV